MAETRVLTCDCTVVHVIQAGSGLRTARPMVQVPFNTKENGAKYQDATYGKGMRLHTVTDKPSGKKVATCTVCGKVKAV